ncbi:MAG: nuclear transport factor 2 family protein [Armatimonadetes bacterium]|nr:nuclear transport factor 2 family protein [Armatimonadota bacterium]
MRMRLSGAAALFFSLWLAGCTAAGPSLEQQLEESYARMNQAFAEEKADPLLAMLTEDFVSVTREGQRLSRAQVPAQLKTTWELGDCRSETRIEKVEAQGDRATLQVRDHTFVEGTNALGLPFKAEIDEKREDVWVNQGGTWKLQSQKTLEIKQIVDGKPVE